MEQKGHKAVISLLFVGVLMGALDISIVGPAIPSIESYLNLGPRFSGWIFSIYVLFNLIGISLFARLSDVYGRRNIYVSALAVFAIGSLVVSLSFIFTGVSVLLVLMILLSFRLERITTPEPAFQGRTGKLA